MHFCLVHREVMEGDYSHLDINVHTHLIRRVTTLTEQNLFVQKR